MFLMILGTVAAFIWLCAASVPSHQRAEIERSWFYRNQGKLFGLVMLGYGVLFWWIVRQ